MKNLGITQRVEVIESYNERRDCLDQSWGRFANTIGFNPIPLANIAPEQVAAYIKDLNLDALVLSGGNSLAGIDETAADAAPERDEFELELIKQAIISKIPVIGVCRGLQVLNRYFHGGLSPITNHVAIKHEIIGTQNDYIFAKKVNSYHNWAIAPNELGEDLIPLATDTEGNIEALIHKNHKLLGIMWHPERETPYASQDIKLFKAFLT
ncbi:MAG TPA: peptidase C26 [Oceanospirillales bacterium]|nr:peptidase C26 [Oceanospirillales bacterium]